VVAKGSYILRHRINNAPQLTIDIKKTKLSRSVDENNVSEYTLSTALIQNAVKEAIGDVVHVEAIVTEELSFNE
jgi:hypothetical protein